MYLESVVIKQNSDKNVSLAYTNHTLPTLSRLSQSTECIKMTLIVYSIVQAELKISAPEWHTFSRFIIQCRGFNVKRCY